MLTTLLLFLQISNWIYMETPKRYSANFMDGTPFVILSIICSEDGLRTQFKPPGYVAGKPQVRVRIGLREIQAYSVAEDAAVWGPGETAKLWTAILAASPNWPLYMSVGSPLTYEIEMSLLSRSYISRVVAQCTSVSDDGDALFAPLTPLGPKQAVRDR